MAQIQVKVIGAERVKRMLKNIGKTAKRQENQMQKPLNKFLKLWKSNMPVVTGFMKNTTMGVVERKGSARAFTQTFGKGGGGQGYAIFPELANQPGKAWKRPHFTVKSVEQFAPKWGKDVTIEIDKALRT